MHMQAELELAPLRARRSDPETSHQAAGQATGLAHAHQERILASLRASECPLGAEQIADHIGILAYQVRKRLSELQDQHLIELAPGERKTRTGRCERLWRPCA
jgi:predicted ArsR family transcriptional regulator